MKALFAALLLAACVSTQANASVAPAPESVDPSWLKDMQVVSCKFGMCKNWDTNQTWDDEEAPDGYTVAFPIEKYPAEKVKQITPAVMEYLRWYGIPQR